MSSFLFTKDILFENGKPIEINKRGSTKFDSILNYKVSLVMNIYTLKWLAPIFIISLYTEDGVICYRMYNKAARIVLTELRRRLHFEKEVVDNDILENFNGEQILSRIVSKQYFGLNMDELPMDRNLVLILEAGGRDMVFDSKNEFYSDKKLLNIAELFIDEIKVSCLLPWEVVLMGIVTNMSVLFSLLFNNEIVTIILVILSTFILVPIFTVRFYNIWRVKQYFKTYITKKFIWEDSNKFLYICLITILLPLLILITFFN